jgi:hypothetical protein
MEEIVAQKVTVHMTDDLTGEVINEGEGRTVTFGFDGTSYEIDLSDKSADDMRELLSEYIAAGRKITGRSGGARTGSRKTSSDDLQKIRQWAQENGHEVSSRGRIASSVREAYDAAH